MSSVTAHDLASVVGANLPYLRRYARALTGSRTPATGMPQRPSRR